MSVFRKKEDSSISSANEFKFRIILMLLISAVLFFAGCQSKKEEAKPPEEKTTQGETNKTQTPADMQSDKEQPVLKPSAEVETKIPDITGTWTGKFDSRATTLKITSQDSTSFKGKITIHYREVINQEVKGTFNPEKMTVSMSDQLHSRYMGKYAAKLSSDMKNLTGTFTMNIDKKKMNFNLTKK